MSATGAAVSTIRVGLDPATAFEVFTGEIGAWYRSGPHSWVDPKRARGVRLEPGVGGRFMEVYDEGEGYVFGRVTAWEPGKRLVLAWLHHEGGYETEVEVRFEGSAEPSGGTLVVLEHRGWDLLPPDVAAAGLAGVGKGWPVFLRWFADFVAGGTTNER